MRMTEELGWSVRGLNTNGSAKSAPKAAVHVESPAHCAYNQTRECFLGLEVVATELTYVGLGEVLAKQSLKSGEGIWLNPFHGIPTSGLFAPLDLVYLDENCRVVEVVESFPTFLASSSIPRDASVLLLPVHSIYSSQTQVGDQLILCVAEEMEARLDQLAGTRDDSGVVQGAVLLREQPLWSGGPGLPELEGESQRGGSNQPQAHEMSLIEPGIKAVRPPKNWLERWWSPDPRKAPREPSPGLAAYYWNGATPKANFVRDISATGLYVVTEERWYPGTLVLMTLQRTDSGDEIAERSISVLSRAVRWGNDGVGLQFVLNDEKNTQKPTNPQLDGASKKDLARFLQRLLKVHS
jgi:hypothetical protein